jgi:hypothetical protein
MTLAFNYVILLLKKATLYYFNKTVTNAPCIYLICGADGYALLFVQLRAFWQFL